MLASNKHASSFVRSFIGESNRFMTATPALFVGDDCLLAFFANFFLDFFAFYFRDVFADASGNYVALDTTKDETLD
jgi:hypothetical protein